MILEAAPLRGLITRPRGNDGTPTSSMNGMHGSGPLRSSTPTAVAATPPTKFTPEGRRRLQGTLLTCGLYKRTPAAAFREANAAIVQFTATFGGDPHGIVRTKANLAAVARSIGTTLDLQATDRLLCAVALHQSYGFDFGLVASLAFGATLYLEDEISPKRIAKLLREHDINVFPATPALYGAMMRVPTVKPLKLPNARYLSSGSSLPAPIAEGFYERFGVRPLSLYHSTQTGPLAIDRSGKDPESVGLPFKHVEIRVAGPEGKKLGSGTEGPLWIKSEALSILSVPKMSLPKRGNDTAIGALDGDGWFRTGDLGHVDGADRIHITGREDDLVKVDGKRLALSEVEGCLETFPKVKAARVRVIMDDLGGPMVVAQVVRIGTCKAEELIDHCARNLAPYKVPRQIEFCEQF
jgi:acyl-coenzyme A synthetase/AMP-(fatty) acid ligase